MVFIKVLLHEICGLLGACAIRETGSDGVDGARTIAGSFVIIAFLTAAADVEELFTPPNFGFHPLVGDREGTSALTLTKNWRLTFNINDNQSIVDLDIEDCH